MMKFLSLGEAMVELSPAEGGLFRRGFAGDTLNTAWYMQALMGAGVGYATVLGHDAMSDAMAAFIGAAGIDTSRIRRDDSRSVGLYMISLADGERSFTYWRGQSAARLLADDPDWLGQVLAGVEMIYVSGITLAILEPARRAVLLDALQTAREAGARVAFDPNLRPRLWSSTTEMCAAITEAAACCDIALPSFDDEAEHFGDISLQATAERYAKGGAAEVMVKNGGGAMLTWYRGAMAPVNPGAPVTPVDTTGAGDSFNGGYLSARLAGASLEEAARKGHAVAAQVVRHPGALMPMDLLKG
ncbi:2-keto-3-deoxygluconate kinase [Pseudooceanicola antarcticus]|uniref:2-keto-3-deoxygluconate kinase n=2 Tax=Pseudooceanicola antarcticus TaxID=1247613 RepID=A0A285JBZ3_9RHOB|nr:2-keto-3-deoxygluconate kinase [Pseudooceanicola antarcticus]